jgi:DHA1 family bicyclomycin/chloramphenicol resistance-like MFS transporter
MCFCALLGIKGPATFSEALAVPVAQMGRASALMVLMLLVASAGATQAVAPYLERGGLAAVAGAMLLLSLLSVSFVARYPVAACAATLPKRLRT